MPISTQKQAFIAAMKVSHHKLDETLRTLDEIQWTQPKTCGDWSIKDVVAHMSDWQKRVLDWYRAGKRGEIPQAPDPDFGWDQIDEINESIYQRHRDEPLQQVRANFDTSWQQILAAVIAMSEQELFQPRQYPWLGDYILADVIANNTTDHYAEHLKSIQAWLLQTDMQQE